MVLFRHGELLMQVLLRLFWIVPGLSSQRRLRPWGEVTGDGVHQEFIHSRRGQTLPGASGTLDLHGVSLCLPQEEEQQEGRGRASTGKILCP